MTEFKQPSFFDDEPLPHADDGAPKREASDASSDDLEPTVSHAESAQAVDPGTVDGTPARVDPERQAPAPTAKFEPTSPARIPEPQASTNDFASFWGPREDSGFAETSSAEQPAAAGGLADPGQEAVDAFFGPPRLDRPRAQRAPLVPNWAWLAAGGVVVALVLVFVGVVLAGRAANISVPQLTGTDSDTARTRLAEQGLLMTITERRFSATATGMVLGQTPPAGTKVKRGDTVSLVVSAGSELFALPSVVGDGLLLARGQLETRGLEVRVEAQPSQQPSDTVLASNPPAGTSVHTGDIVRLTVAAAGPSTALLLPYDMKGVTVVIDPAPVNDAQTDVTLDVARRLRSLIEASHGVVVATRALADSSALEDVPTRAKRAAATTATVAVGLSTSAVGAGGLTVFAPSPVLQFASASAKLSSRIASDLASEAGSVKSATATTDTVLAAARSPWSRVELGSFAQREDIAKFTDSAWADSVARALYRAIASSYGKKTATP